ncbi:hypothetical protein PAXRUDRAFT_822422 [Paxillus rubicundulus Ve08.2h10]|uniref:Uncharacterized protein n=1 Tax=Paxillus rubicundulus Ve08.2h10 TaxID=930991 RepID=A0A0D0DWH6_9AGAM|nr:hypothetical protein PAXRUDRAFT_822422 [Paxillus rubicundulus Ve08.2h10]
MMEVECQIRLIQCDGPDGIESVVGDPIFGPHTSFDPIEVMSGVCWECHTAGDFCSRKLTTSTGCDCPQYVTHSRPRITHSRSRVSYSVF